MKRIITLSLAFVLILLALTSCNMMNKITKKGAQTEVAVETQELVISQTEEVADEIEDSALLVLSDYLGNWHPANEAGEVELRILSADSYSVEFSLWVADSGEINNVYADVSGNTATFSMSDSDNKISGELIFEESLIKLKIEKTKVNFLSVGTVIFDGKHTASYQDKYNAENETDIVYTPDVPAGVVTPTYFTEPYNKYVNTPNNILYLRSGPAKSYEGLEKMPHNSLVEVNGFNADRTWVYVYYYAEGVYGWCSDEYLVY